MPVVHTFGGALGRLSPLPPTVGDMNGGMDMPADGVSANGVSADGAPEVEIRRSARRTRTVQARVEGNRIIVFVPARMSRAEEARVVREMVAKLQRKMGNGRSTGRSDSSLSARAEALRSRYVPEAQRPSSVRWVTNQNTRWGSCTPTTARIRLSHKLHGMPDYVVDYVLVHELAHLVHADHSPRFWAVVDRFPQGELAKTYLAGAAFGAGLPGDVVPGVAADDERGGGAGADAEIA